MSAVYAAGGLSIPLVKLSFGAKAFLAMLALVGVVAFGAIVDLGVNAGRIHYGVSVGGVPVGGMILTEAAETLEIEGIKRRDTHVVFTMEGLTRVLVPKRVGWRPQPFDSARKALEVGRGEGIFDSAKERWSAWLGGVELDWAGRANPRRMRRLAESWASEAAALGAEVDVDALVERMERAITTWPRRTFQIPHA